MDHPRSHELRILKEDQFCYPGILVKHLRLYPANSAQAVILGLLIRPVHLYLGVPTLLTDRTETPLTDVLARNETVLVATQNALNATTTIHTEAKLLQA